MISYAQNFEDVMLMRVFNGKTNGFYIDVGAWHPVNHSVTKYFYDLGWSGINVEPAEKYAKLLDKQRLRDINLRCVVGDSSDVVSYWEVPGSGASTTLHDSWGKVVEQGSLADGTVQRKVECRALSEICAQYAKEKEVDFLKIDVEGAERSVIASGDWKKYRPIVVIVEAVAPFSNTPNHAEWEDLLKQSGYVFAYFDGLNRFYVRKESVELLPCFSVPPNVFDGFRRYEDTGKWYKRFSFGRLWLAIGIGF